MSLVTMLTAETHTKWKNAIRAAALSAGGWGILAGKSTIPHVLSSQKATLSEDEKKENWEWERRQEKVAGVIYLTLDEGHLAIVQDIDAEDAKKLWDTLDAQYEKKSIGGRFFAMQNLMAILYRDAEHPTETLFEFGNRVVNGSKKLRHLLPEGTTFTQATSTDATAVCNDTGAHKVNITQGTFTPAVFKPSFTADMFIDELAINVILIGLGRAEEVQQLKHNLIHSDIKSLTDVLSALQKEDTLQKSDEMGTANAAALAARQPPKPTPTTRNKEKYFCSKHGANKSHSSKDCKFLISQGGGAKAAGEEGGEIKGERAMAAGVKQLASPPTL